MVLPPIPIIAATPLMEVHQENPIEITRAVQQWAQNIGVTQTRMVWAIRIDAIPGKVFVDRSAIDYPSAYCIETASVEADDADWFHAATALSDRLPEAEDYRVVRVTPDGRRVVARAGTPILTAAEGVSGPSGGMTFRSPIALARLIASRIETSTPALIEPLPGGEGARVRIDDLGLDAELIRRGDAWGVRRFTTRVQGRVTEEVVFDQFTQAQRLPLLVGARYTSSIASPDLEGAAIKDGVLVGVGPSTLRPHSESRLISSSVGTKLAPAGFAVDLDRWAPLPTFFPASDPDPALDPDIPASGATTKPLLGAAGMPVWALVGSGLVLTGGGWVWWRRR